MSAPLGLLAGLNDPMLMARLAERERIAERLAQQMGVTRQRAIEALVAFEGDLCREGVALH